jgi:paraquat-inducible protein A
MSETPIVICEHCDAVYRRRPLPLGQLARCSRCHAPLYRNRPIDLDVMLALAFAALIVLIVANVFPIVNLQVSNDDREATLWGAILATYDSGVGFVALLAALTVFFYPLIQLLLYLHVLLPLRVGMRGAAFNTSMHLLRAMQPWSMVEVFVLGVLVAVVKLTSMAEVTPMIGMWGFAVLTVLMTWLNSYDLHQLWDIAEERCDGRR